MAGFRCLQRHWRQIGNCYQSHSYVVHLYLVPYNGISNHYLYDPGFLDEYEKICEGR